MAESAAHLLGPELDYIREAGGVAVESNALMASIPKQLAFSPSSKAKTLPGGRQAAKPEALRSG